MIKKQRTLLDELGQLWPLLDVVHYRILCEVGDNPGQSMSEIALRLDMELNTVFFNVMTMGDGYRGRQSFGLLRIEKCTKDKRRKLIKLTKAGYEVARLLQPLNVPIENIKIEKIDAGQLDIFSKTSKDKNLKSGS